MQLIHFQLKGRHCLSYFLFSLFFLTESLTVTAVTTSTHTASTASSINLITPGFIGLVLLSFEVGREATGDTWRPEKTSLLTSPPAICNSYIQIYQCLDNYPNISCIVCTCAGSSILSSFRCFHSAFSWRQRMSRRHVVSRPISAKMSSPMNTFK